jgi:hypothetical protein
MAVETCRLRQGLDATALEFLTPFRDIIPSALSQYRETGRRRHLSLCHACTSLFHSYARWLPPAKMMLVEFVPVLVALIAMPELQVRLVFVPVGSACVDACVHFVVIQGDVVPIVSVMACRKYGKADGEFVFPFLERLLPICCSALEKPDPLHSRLQTAAAVAVSDVGEHMLPWLQQQVIVSKDAAVKVAPHGCSGGLRFLSIRRLFLRCRVCKPRLLRYCTFYDFLACSLEFLLWGP